MAGLKAMREFDDATESYRRTMKKDPHVEAIIDAQVHKSFERCDCGHAYFGGLDWWKQCPRCHPEQAKPIGERLVDPNEPMGPEYVWDDARGIRGMWVKQ